MESIEFERLAVALVWEAVVLIGISHAILTRLRHGN